MRLHTSNESYFVHAEVGFGKSILHCVSKDGTVAKCKLKGEITGLLLRGDKLFCLAEYSDKKYVESVVLHTYSMALQELASETLTKSTSKLLSALDATSIYILNVDRGSTSFVGDTRSFWEVCTPAFTKIDLESGTRTEWTLDDFKNGYECGDKREELFAGCVITGIDKIHAFDGKLILTCTVYDPNSVIEIDDPEFDENELDDDDYVEMHSYTDAFCADVDTRTLSYVHEFCPEVQGLRLKRSRGSHDEESILNIVPVGSKYYVATERHFYCVDLREGRCLADVWYHMGIACDNEDALHIDTDTEMYRYFYAWGNDLIFESRENDTLVGFRVCPAQLEEPEAALWRTIKLKKR